MASLKKFQKLLIFLDACLIVSCITFLLYLISSFEVSQSEFGQFVRTLQTSLMVVISLTIGFGFVALFGLTNYNIIFGPNKVERRVNMLNLTKQVDC